MQDLTPTFFNKIQKGMTFEDLAPPEQEQFLKDWISSPSLRSTIKSPPSIAALEDYKNELDKKVKEVAGLIKELRDKEQRPAIVSTNRPIPPGEKSKILTTHELDADGKLIKGQRYWDPKTKTMKKPAFVTGDVALSESEEGDKKRHEVMEEIKKSREKK